MDELYSVIRKPIRILLLIAMIAAPIWFVYDQFAMASKVSHLKDKMWEIVEAKESGKIESYNGRIDSLVAERTKILNANEYIALGTKWSTESDFTALIYFDASWYSNNAKNYIKIVTDHGVKSGSANLLDALFVMVMLLFKPILYGFVCVSFYCLQRK